MDLQQKPGLIFGVGKVMPDQGLMESFIGRLGGRLTKRIKDLMLADTGNFLDDLDRHAGLKKGVLERLASNSVEKEGKELWECQN